MAMVADAAGKKSPSNHHPAVLLSRKPTRLVVVTATDVDRMDETRTVTDSIKRRASSADRFLHVCAEAGAQQLRQALENVVEVPDEPVRGYQLSKCRRGAGEPCGQHFESQIKLLYGFVFEFRRRQRDREEMPRWWLVKDSDTYVHVPNLMANLDTERGGKPLWTQEVSFSHLLPSCPAGVCGGAGWLISAPLAQKLVAKVGDKSVQYQLNKLFVETENSYYDAWLPQLVEWAGAKIEDALFMSVSQPSDSALCGLSKWYCPDDDQWCVCARSGGVLPATWQMKGEPCCDHMDRIP